MDQENAITTERVRILYENAFAGINTAIAGVLTISYILWDKLDSQVILIWIAFMLLMTLVRHWLVFDYNKNKQKILFHELYEKRYSYAAAVIGICWAFIIVMGLNLDDYEYRLYSLLILISIMAISIPIFSSSPKTSYYYLAPSLIITIPLLLSRGGKDSALGAALIVFTYMAIRVSRCNFNRLNDTLILRYQTQLQSEKLNQLQDEISSSEKRMQGIMDYAPIAICVKDLDGHFTFLNKKVTEFYQISGQELIGKTLYDVLPEDIAHKMNKNDLEVIKTGKTTKYDESAPLEDGLHHFISTKFPLFDENGNLYAVGGISTDITERVRINDSLRLSQQRLLLHREQSPLGIIDWNMDFEILDWNPAAQRIFGFAKDDVLGRDITDRILPDSSRKQVEEIWEKLISNKGGEYSLNENTTKAGNVILCEWHNTPLVDENGEVIGVTSLVDDVTERETTAETLRQTQKMNAIGKLTGGVAHDFNNMLGVILGFANALKNKINKDENELIKYSDQIITAGTRAAKLTSKLLEFSRTAPSFSESISINVLLTNMRDMLEKTLTHRIKLTYELQENIWPVWLDKGRLEDCILNLSINAMHAMPEGGILTIQSKNIHHPDSDAHLIDVTPGDYVLISVIDSGIGMAKEVQEKIFDPFFTTKGENGTGLGLSQVYGFIQQLEGNIKVYSVLDEGTRMDFYIPRYKDEEDEKLIVNLSDTIDTPSGNETILVVDDEESLLELAEMILVTYGYNVICTESSEQALDVLKNNSVDLLLTDVIMPGMDGYQLVAEVKKLYPEIKIQIVSGYVEEENVCKVGDKIHENRLHKPYSAEVLLSKIRTLLDG